ncbi:uncharacterized protein BO87DRAFT_378488 [Aspergillus neoniger CBS 115656]|uniref:Uncharacterized protein n=1 Tax=Aspergillus neoniger (strain CBS 115656) TaxID=1448310 RepID=A0A318YCS9_ASPNB|nr:hypothetical protein BO87DRAFT_378488 [Aspergillus neoniger CBS 115656]PYH32221.1 hypothetical protein BO87DRAFT_378488 [Aspergillus neoniger CBS 115656]
MQTGFVKGFASGMASWLVVEDGMDQNLSTVWDAVGGRTTALGTPTSAGAADWHDNPTSLSKAFDGLGTGNLTG